MKQEQKRSQLITSEAHTAIHILSEKLQQQTAQVQQLQDLIQQQQSDATLQERKIRSLIQEKRQLTHNSYEKHKELRAENVRSAAEIQQHQNTILMQKAEIKLLGKKLVKNQVLERDLRSLKRKHTEEITKLTMQCEKRLKLQKEEYSRRYQELDQRAVMDENNHVSCALRRHWDELGPEPIQFVAANGKVVKYVHVPGKESDTPSKSTLSRRTQEVHRHTT